MTTRYKTAGEKAGVKRRVKAFRERQKEAGLKERPFWLDDNEAALLRGVLAVWRNLPSTLDARQRKAAMKLITLEFRVEKTEKKKPAEINPKS